MKYYSTNKSVPEVSLMEAVTKGLAADKGLFMPERIDKFPAEFFENIHKLSFQEIAFEVQKILWRRCSGSNPERDLCMTRRNFDCPVVHVNDNIYSPSFFTGLRWLLKM
jgi:threonine synthase